MPQAEILQHRERANRFLAATLKLARTEGKCSQDELAKRMSLQRSYISRTECGHNVPNFATILLWGSATGIPAWKIVKRVERLMKQESEHQAIASHTHQPGPAPRHSAV
jgi:transcriptional regulator with XRE-family HTH domain